MSFDNFDPASTPPLAYAMHGPSRPGMITALGICSIVIGSLGILASLCGTAQTVMYLVMSNITMPAIPATSLPTTLPATFPASGVGITPSTMGATTVTGWTSTSTTYTYKTVPGGFPFRVSHTASILSFAGELLSLAVAVLLLMAGISILRNSRSALRMHWAYIFLKVPITIIAAIAVWWTASEMMTNIAAMSPSSASPMPNFGNTMGLIQAGFSMAISLLYPIALIVILSVRPIKVYFKNGGAY